MELCTCSFRGGSRVFWLGDAIFEGATRSLGSHYEVGRAIRAFTKEFGLEGGTKGDVAGRKKLEIDGGGSSVLIEI
jgi:hypothetical protein